MRSVSAAVLNRMAYTASFAAVQRGKAMFWKAISASRHGEDAMEVGDRQQLGLAGGQPLVARHPLALRAMPVAAGVVGAAHEAAIGTGLGVAAERCGPAQRDGAHHPPLDAAEMTIVGAPVGVAVAAEHVRHFQTGRQGIARSVRRAARPPGSTGQVGSGCAGSGRSRLAYRAPCSTGWHDPAAPG